MQKEDFKQIHSHSIRNHDEINKSKMCVCFDCCRRFEASEIDEWTDNEQTAICPYCGTDAVIGDASEIRYTDKIINELHAFYFFVTDSPKTIT